VSAAGGPRRGEWVTLTAGVRVSRTWMLQHTPTLLGAYCDARTPDQRRTVAARILSAAAAEHAGPDVATPAPDPSWRAALETLDPRLASGPDWPPLALSLARAAAAGYDLRARLPVLLTAPLPDRHPARELHWRLLDDCPAALPDPPPEHPAAAGPGIHAFPRPPHLSRGGADPDRPVPPCPHDPTSGRTAP
jgi:hypothetical protein